jgi:UDP-GlcNAc:undecaprenyl-phosphate/decaprenyl-phosphate GlcNAc-1-phosphate transferase
MAAAAFAKHLIFAFALFLTSAVLTWLMMRANIVDIPNHRSSHEQPVPNSGGVAIVVTALLGFSIVYAISVDVRIAEHHMIGLGLAALAIVVVSLLDDFGKLRTFKIKLGTQLFAAAILLAFDIVIREITLPIAGSIPLGWWGYPLTLLWVVGMTNMFNFMDGLNGLAGGTAVLVAAFFALITFLQGSVFVYILCYVLFAASLGFLVFNFPSGRIFMGDVGSQFLGFAFAVIAVVAAGYDAARTSLLIMPLLFFNFLFDTAFTFVRRLRAGEDVTQAHRSHLYQLFQRLGYSHVQVSLFHFAVAVAQGLGALALLQSQSPMRAFIFLPFVVFQGLYAWMIVRAARRRGLI